MGDKCVPQQPSGQRAEQMEEKHGSPTSLGHTLPLASHLVQPVNFSCSVSVFQLLSPQVGKVFIFFHSSLKSNFEK